MEDNIIEFPQERIITPERKAEWEALQQSVLMLQNSGVLSELDSIRTDMRSQHDIIADEVVLIRSLDQPFVTSSWRRSPLLAFQTRFAPAQPDMGSLSLFLEHPLSRVSEIQGQRIIGEQLTVKRLGATVYEGKRFTLFTEKLTTNEKGQMIEKNAKPVILWGDAWRDTDAVRKKLQLLYQLPPLPSE